jgi:S-disulfanyl-L-cysteine oxidoreductase SoxD
MRKLNVIDGRSLTMRNTSNLLVAAMTVLSGLIGAAALAQMPTYKLGKTLSAEENRQWATGIGPEGKELPPGSGSAKEGKALWMRRCAKCHGVDARSSMPGSIRPPTPDNNPVLGGEKGLIQATQYATTIWDYINRAMPLGEEAGSLTKDEVYAATAYLFYLEKIIKEDEVMDAKTLPKVHMPHASGDLSPYKRRF